MALTVIPRLAKSTFVTVVLHEIGHGLGFAGTASVDDGANSAECDGVIDNGCFDGQRQMYTTDLRLTPQREAHRFSIPIRTPITLQHSVRSSQEAALISMVRPPRMPMPVQAPPCMALPHGRAVLASHISMRAGYNGSPHAIDDSKCKYPGSQS